MDYANIAKDLKIEKENIEKLKEYISWLESEVEIKDKEIEKLESKIFAFEDNPRGYSYEERYCY